MNTYVNTGLKVVLSILMIMPIFGALGIFPAPTADMYNTPEAFSFISVLMNAGYINVIMAIVFALAIIALWTNRVALAALLILPLTVNIFAFHLFLDGGIFTAGSIMANVFVLLNAYFLYQQRAVYQVFLAKNA